ncbi:MAG: orotate phosphoribosyltransferase [Chitinophagales bacterium]
MSKNKEIAFKVAEYLLKIKAIKLSPQGLFTWASGKKSPIYCDNRVILSYPEARNFIKKTFTDVLKEKYPDAEMIAGVATGAIAIGVLVAEEMGLPFCYVRSKAKEHGRKNMVEGDVPAGTKVVVVEDLISTGGSSLKAVEGLREIGAEVIGLEAIFTYSFQQSITAFTAANCKMDTLSDFPSLVAFAKANNLYKEDDIVFMEEWYKSM